MVYILVAGCLCFQSCLNANGLRLSLPLAYPCSLLLATLTSLASYKARFHHGVRCCNAKRGTAKMAEWCNGMFALPQGIAGVLPTHSATVFRFTLANGNPWIGLAEYWSVAVSECRGTVVRYHVRPAVWFLSYMFKGNFWQYSRDTAVLCCYDEEFWVYAHQGRVQPPSVCIDQNRLHFNASHTAEVNVVCHVHGLYGRKLISMLKIV